MKTQGTKIYIIDPDETEPTILTIQCATSITGLDAPRDQLETTCLESAARTYDSGLPTPGPISVGLQFDPTIASHARLYELFQAGTKFDMAIGYSDGTAAADVDSSGAFDLPTTRSFIVALDAFVSNVSQDWNLNAVVTATVTIQQSGLPVPFAKS